MAAQKKSPVKKPPAPRAPKPGKPAAGEGGKGERRPRGDDDEETGGEELEAGERYAGESDDGDDGRSADGGDDGESSEGEGGEDGEVVDAAAELVDEDEIGDEDREAVSRPGAKRGPADDSVALSRSDPLQAYLREVQRHSLLTPEEEKSLAVRYAETQDVVAARRLVTANLRLVVKIAYEYRRAYKNIMDLIQEGNIGLMQAVKKYDPHRGVKLSSYSAWWIRAYILRFIINNWRLVKLGTTQAQRKLFFNLNKEKAKLAALGIDPTSAEIAKRLGVEENEAMEMDRRLSSSEASLDAPVGDNEGRAVARIELLPSSGQGPDSMVADEQVQHILRAKLAEFRKTLKGKDIDIFDRRLVAEDPLTLQELGDQFGVSRERVRQIEARLTVNLRNYLKEALGDAMTSLGPCAKLVPLPLYVVATPIGNLEDLTRRAERVLRECDRVLAEDTRRTLGLLTHLGLKKPLDRLDEHAREADIARALGFLLEGKSLCLVSDAGTPLVSDPGATLVRAAKAAGVPIVPIPGASAVMAALVLAGAAGPFRFVGFFPRAGAERGDALSKAATDADAVVFFEAANRTRETLADLAALVPDRRATVTRELTKLHEEAREGTLTELAADEAEIRGEITVVLHAYSRADVTITDDDVDKWIDEELARGTPVKKLADIVAARSGRSRRDVYARALERKPR